jgi:hypothetical protein
VRARTPPPARLLAAFRKEARHRSLTPSSVLSFAVEQPAIGGVATRSRLAKSALASPAAFHVVFARAAAQKAADAPVILLVAREVDGRIVSYRELHRRGRT